MVSTPTWTLPRLQTRGQQVALALGAVLALLVASRGGHGPSANGGEGPIRHGVRLPTVLPASGVLLERAACASQTPAATSWPVVVAAIVERPEKAAACSLTFKAYAPSAAEASFDAIARKFSKEPDRSHQRLCITLGTEPWLGVIGAWLRAAAERLALIRSGTLRDMEDLELASRFTLSTLDAAAPGVFSRLLFVDSCSGGEVIVPIEPLAGLLRDPTEVCVRNVLHYTDENAPPSPPDADAWVQAVMRQYTKNAPLAAAAVALRAVLPPLDPHLQPIQSRAHILLDPARLLHWRANGGRRLLIFDVGASYYHPEGSWGGSEGAKWFIETARGLGVPYSAIEIFAFEAMQRPKLDYYQRMPAEVMARTRFFNFPVSTAVGDTANPLTLLRQYAQSGDYVMFKLDIDDAPMESEFVRQILSDDGSVSPTQSPLRSVITELFWEPHFW